MDQPRRRDETGNPTKELEWIQHKVRRTLSPVLELVGDLTGDRDPHALEAHRGTKDIATESFERGTVVLFDDDPGFDVHAVNVRRQLLTFRRFE
jgi:hypothetical protein